MAQADYGNMPKKWKSKVGPKIQTFKSEGMPHRQAVAAAINYVVDKHKKSRR